MDFTIQKIEGLLLIAALVAMLARRLKLPYSAGLVMAGIMLALSPFSFNIALTKDLVFNAFLPPLIFEAAFYLKWPQLRRDLPVILFLATFGLLLAAGITATGMHYLTGWAWESAAVFGILIAATDPVSVIATFKEAGVHGRLRLLVEAESLLNDGTAAVGFTVTLAIAAGQELTAFGMTSLLLTTVLGALLCGALVASAILLIVGKTNDHLVEITFTTIAAYGSFLLAEHFHLSGVLSTLTTGLIVGNLGSLGALSERGRESVIAFWEYVAFVANSLIFILIGMHEAQQQFAPVIFPALIGIVLVTLGRAVTIYPCCALFAKSALKVDMKHQHVLFWGGLRGALALALALGLPPELPHRDAIITVAFSVVAFSVFVQGLTMTPLLRKLGEIGTEAFENKK